MKARILETLREAIRQARIQRDQGNNLAHNDVTRLTLLLGRVRAMKGAELKDFADSYGIDLD